MGQRDDDARRQARACGTASPPGGASNGGTSSPSSGSTGPSSLMGRVGSIEDRASFLAGWAAGQAAAASCGPLPDEIARDVVQLLDTTTPAPTSLRRPRDKVKDAG
jgi:hypothetical protein